MNTHIRISRNTIPVPYRAQAEAAVIEGIGSRPGPWEAKLFEPANATWWDVHLKGPEGAEWRFIFDDEEQRPKHIRSTIDQALPKAL